VESPFLGMCLPFAKPDESIYLIIYRLTAYHLPPRTVINTLLSLIFDQYIGFTKSSKSWDKINYKSCTYIIERFPVTLYNLEWFWHHPNTEFSLQFAPCPARTDISHSHAMHLQEVWWVVIESFLHPTKIGWLVPQFNWDPNSSSTWPSSKIPLTASVSPLLLCS